MLTQAQVENEILRLSQRLENLTDELAGRARAAAEAEANYKGRHASVYLETQGSIAERNARADVECHDLFANRLIFAAQYEATKQACRSTESQLDALRTIAANIRAQT
jgi:hypothetical protein